MSVNLTQIQPPELTGNFADDIKTSYEALEGKIHPFIKFSIQSFRYSEKGFFLMSIFKRF
jgi:hypothetical protein